MIGLQNNLSNAVNISLNSYIYHSINIFKYDIREIEEYLQNMCLDNPLVSIGKYETFSQHSTIQYSSGSDMFSEILTHFKCQLDDSDYKTMKFIIYSLNTKGFLEAHPKIIADYTHSSLNRVNELISMLKNYDNKGIGSTDAIDYLKYQLINLDMFHEDYFYLFKEHLSDVSRSDFDFLNDTSSTDRDEFLSYIESIKQNCALSPLTGNDAEPVYPDAVISADNHTLKVEINDYLIRKITFEPLTLETDDNDFQEIMHHYQSQYNEILSLLNAKKKYLFRILSAVSEIQYDYLLGNQEYLNALDQSQLSKKTGLSHATVSRIICNKYVHTPRGLLPLKSLLSKTCSKKWSVSHIKYLIQSINDFEKLSDNKISSHLGEQGISISRRTVNKYKNQILNS